MILYLQIKASLSLSPSPTSFYSIICHVTDTPSPELQYYMRIR